jgi:hypothetical protein
MTGARRRRIGACEMLARILKHCQDARALRVGASIAVPGGLCAERSPTVGTTVIPSVPDTFADYRNVERFTEAHKQTTDPSTWTTWSLEDLGRLARLEADLRSDAGYLGSLADDVHEIMLNAVDDDRSRGRGDHDA